MNVDCTYITNVHAYRRTSYTNSIKKDIANICGSCTVDIPNDIKEHRFENEPNEELQVCIIEHTKVIDQNRSMGRKIDELEKQQELFSKVIKDQEQQLNSKIKTLRKEIQKLQILTNHLGTVKLHRAKIYWIIS